ncbi:MAG: BrnT family toxin [Candidatus Promineofilum sp.]|nr:BrnT family toxin [Promineifilum sp.]MBP9656448.1 BrnT family toxin [Promineifilum sp.]
MKMEWDPRKAARNLSKHEVGFEEAATVFFNPLAVIFEDEWHSESESREIIIGHSADNQLLVVIFVERKDSIRIISARRATASEQNDYEENTYK